MADRGQPVLTEPRTGPASAKLGRILDRMARANEWPPCSRPETCHLWVSEDPYEQRQAITACMECPVVRTCREAALERAEPHGVWGALCFTTRSRATRGAQR